MPRRSHGGNYPPDWPQIAERCKAEAGWRCVRCGHPHDPASGHTLTVHHLDMDPSNCRWWNLAALCQRCHLTIQAKVVMARPWLYEHSEWFRPFVAGYHAYFFGQPDDREYVMANLDRLVNIGRGEVLYSDVEGGASEKRSNRI